jgi:hypothetical protein
MKRIFFVLGLSLISTGVFANDIAEEKNTKEKETEKKEAYSCCTATLTYNGQYVDSQTVCSSFPVYDNCQAARNALLDRNPGAKKALGIQ